MGATTNIERLGSGPNMSGTSQQSFTLCYEKGRFAMRVGSPVEQEVKSYTNRIRLISTDGKNWVRLLSESEAVETPNVHVKTTSKIFCAIEGDHVSCDGDATDDLEENPWMRIEWHSTLYRKLQ